MKKIFLGVSLIALMSMPALASTGGGKKKAKKKAKTECKVAKCDPAKCDPKNCDPKCVDMPGCSKEVKCTPATACTGSK